MEIEEGRGKRHSLVDAIKKKYEEGQTEEEDSFIQIYVPKKGPGAQAQGKVFIFDFACIRFFFLYIYFDVFN